MRNVIFLFIIIQYFGVGADPNIISYYGTGKISYLINDMQITYIATNDGLLVCGPHGIHKSKVLQSYIAAIAIDSNKNIWAISDSGLVCIEKQNILLNVSPCYYNHELRWLRTISTLKNGLIIAAGDSGMISVNKKKLKFIKCAISQDIRQIIAVNTTILAITCNGLFWVLIGNDDTATVDTITMFNKDKFSRIEMDSKGNCYVSIKNEVFLINGKNLVPLLKSKDDYVLDFSINCNSDIGIFTYRNKIAIYEKLFNGIDSYSMKCEKGIPSSTSIEQDGDNFIVYGDDMLKLIETVECNIAAFNDKIAPSSQVFSVYVDSNGTCWTGTAYKGIGKLQYNKWTVIDIANSNLEENAIMKIAPLPNGKKLVGTRITSRWGFYIRQDIVDNYYCLSENGIIKLNMQNTVSGEIILNKTTPIGDIYDNIWFACNTSDGELAVARYASNGALECTKGSLIHDEPTCIAQSNSGHFYIGTKNNGIKTFDGKNWSYCEASNDKYNINAIEMIVFDKNGGMWVTGNGGRIFYVKNGKWNEFSDEINEKVNDIRIDTRGNIWINKYLLWKKGNKIDYIKKYNLPTKLTDVFFENDSTVWFSSLEGLFKIIE
jgi:hypothetical protein